MCDVSHAFEFLLKILAFWRPENEEKQGEDVTKVSWGRNESRSKDCCKVIIGKKIFLGIGASLSRVTFQIGKIAVGTG
jgi:hypothetical protein